MFIIIIIFSILIVIINANNNDNDLLNIKMLNDNDININIYGIIPYDNTISANITLVLSVHNQVEDLYVQIFR